MESHQTEAPRTHIKSEVVVARAGFKIIRMRLPAGEALPVHNAPRDVAIAVVSGAGRITVERKEFAAEPGTVVDVPRGAPHGVAADEPLEILVIQSG